jgi:hypothetical protein
VLLELGVFEGCSAKVFAQYLPGATVIGVDRNLKSIDIRGYPNLFLREGDQGDELFLNALVDELAPGGLDVVIDDASHIGYLSQQSFRTLFPRVKSGGIYVVEDWGTGYWNDWPDGGSYQRNRVDPYDGEFPRRIISHDFGMVGFLKSLVDEVGAGDIRPSRAAPPNLNRHVRGLHIYLGTSIVEKL